MEIARGALSRQGGIPRAEKALGRCESSVRGCV